VLDKSSKQIICTAFATGRKHDFKLYQASKLTLMEQTIAELDSGYQGVQKQHVQTRLPYKKSKHHPLTKQQRKDNTRLASSRVLVEHVIRKLKIFKIVSEKYRNRRKRFALRMNLIAGFYNYQLLQNEF
jgi:IS5 family transposase